MKEKEFTGGVEKILPEKIIDKDKVNDLDNFFLVLGLIFNDLKDTIVLLNTFNEVYRNPKTDGTEVISAHIGNWSGLQNNVSRRAISLISEFLVFLEKEKVIINSFTFGVIVKRLPDDIKSDWNDILVSVNGKGDKSSLFSKIAELRNNISFHYDHSLTKLRKGFIKKFFDSPKNKFNEKAMYSLDGSMEGTRFYYCDGAAEEYVRELMKISPETSYIQEVIEIIKKTNRVIIFMMDIYLKSKIK